MSLLQLNSIKISKILKVSAAEQEKNFVCGECIKGYNSYAALRLHIKRRHNGIVPADTKIVQTPRPKLDCNIRSGRPAKSSVNIDIVDDKEADLELVENDLLDFFAEKLMIMSPFVSKLPVTEVISRILNLPSEGKDKWFGDMQDELKQFLSEFKGKSSKTFHLDFEEEYRNLDFARGLNVIAWTIIWLAQIYIRSDFVADVYVVFSKIWKVLDQDQLDVQDLDNKLIWKKICKECEDSVKDLSILKSDQNLLQLLIQKVCKLIGKAAEGKSLSESSSTTCS